MEKNKPDLKKFRLLVFSLLMFIISSSGAQVITQTFSYTGSMQSFTVPSCVGKITLDVRAAQGGLNATSTNTGGRGGSASGILNVTAGDVWNIFVTRIALVQAGETQINQTLTCGGS